MSESKMLRFTVGEDCIDRIDVSVHGGKKDAQRWTHTVRLEDIRSVGTIAMWVHVQTTKERIDIRMAGPDYEPAVAALHDSILARMGVGQ